MTLVKTADLDPDKSYLFGFHPHGVISLSAFCTFATEALGFSKVFPGGFKAKCPCVRYVEGNPLQGSSCDP